MKKFRAPGRPQGSTPQRGALLVAFLLIITAAPRVTSQSVRPPMEDAVVAVLVHDPGAGKFVKRATAFHVGDGAFYTNAHVVSKPLPPNFSKMYLAGIASTRAPESWMGPVQVTCVNPRWQSDGSGDRAHPFDVARLLIPQLSHLPPALVLSSEVPDVGMHVTVAGFAAASHGWPPKLYQATGHIEAVDRTTQTFLIKVESGFALEGSSGSPVLTDVGEVIGILFARQGIPNRSAASRVAAITTQAMRSSCP